MQYIVEKVQEKYKNYENIASDTIIFEACRHFSETGNTQQYALSMLYSGCVHEENADKEAAMIAYKKSFELYQSIKDSLGMANAKYYIGNLMYVADYYNDAMQNYKDAMALYGDNLLKKASLCDEIGKIFALMDENDSSLFYFYEGVKMVNMTDDLQLRCKLYNNLSVVLKQLGRYDEAINAMKISFDAEKANQPLIHLNLASIYLEMGNNDSSEYYVSLLKDELQSVTTNNFLISAYSFLSKYSASTSKYDSAYFYQKKLVSLVEEISDKRLKQSVYEVSCKYDYEKLQNTLNTKVIRRQRIAIFSGLAFFITVFIAIYLFVRNKEIKRREKSMKDELESLKLQSSNINIMANDSIQWRLDLITELEKCKKKEIVYKTEWEYLRRLLFDKKESAFEASVSVIEKYYPNLYNTICEKYPNLNDTEIKVCLLSCTDLSNSDMANILDLSIYTINKNRSSLRDKMNLEPQNLKKQLKNAFSF